MWYKNRCSNLVFKIKNETTGGWPPAITNKIHFQPWNLTSSPDNCEGNATPTATPAEAVGGNVDSDDSPSWAFRVYGSETCVRGKRKPKRSGKVEISIKKPICLCKKLFSPPRKAEGWDVSGPFVEQSEVFAKIAVKWFVRPRACYRVQVK